MLLRKVIFYENCFNHLLKRSAFTKANENHEKNTKELLLKLRNKSGYPLINCKEALKATNYDVQKAEDYLLNIARAKGWKEMKDISPNQLNQGLIGVAKNQKLAAIVEINCVTDFVAKTTDFQSLVKDAAETVLHHFSTDTKRIVSSEEIHETLIPGGDQKFSDKIALTIGKIKEQVLVRRACLLAAPPGGAIAAYVHPLVSSSPVKSTLGTYVALASISCVNDGRMPRYIAQRGRDICQHIVGMKPLTIGQYPPNDAEAPEVGSTKDEGDVSGDDCKNLEFDPPISTSRELLKQPFLLDSDISVEQWLDMTDMKIHDFIRYQVGNYSE